MTIPEPDFYRRVDNADLEVRRDRWGFIHLAVLRGNNPKFLSLTADQAAAVRDGITALLETQP